MDKEWYYLDWIKGKTDNYGCNSLIEQSRLPHSEHQKAEEDLRDITGSENDAINAWIEKYLSAAQVKTMKAAYRKKMSRRNSGHKDIADTIELPYVTSVHLARLAKDKNITKRQYIYDLIDEKHYELVVRQDEEQRDKIIAELDKEYELKEKERAIKRNQKRYFAETAAKNLMK
jgi:macrodomain Ter protein organizer (MatP/YcbG family)